MQHCDFAGPGSCRNATLRQVGSPNK